MSNNLGNKEIMASNIKHYMDINGIERNDICKALNIKYSTFSDWVNANTYPRIDKIELMAKYFNITKADLVEPRNLQRNISDAVRLPVLGAIAGGIPIEAMTESANTDETGEWEEIPSSWLTGEKQYLALKVSGDSMSPLIADGDVAIIEHNYNWVNGAVMAVYVNGYNATLKKVRITSNGMLMLEAFNANYETQIFTPEEIESLPVKPIGLLVETRKKWN